MWREEKQKRQQLETENEAIKGASKGGSNSQVLTPHNEPKQTQKLY